MGYMDYVQQESTLNSKNDVITFPSFHFFPVLINIFKRFSHAFLLSGQNGSLMYLLVTLEISTKLCNVMHVGSLHALDSLW